MPPTSPRKFKSSCQYLARSEAAALPLAILLLLLIATTPTAQAQTLTVLHNFTGGIDGANPYAGLTMDAAGNLYGTTCGSICQPGLSNAGTVYRLSKRGSGWVFTPLYAFSGGIDGALPATRVIIGPNGTLYGTAIYGGSYGSGTVFNLKPPATAPPNILGGWTETVLYHFTGGGDGANPEAEPTFDQAGNLYGTTYYGGQYGFGTVFELMPAGSGWTESVLHTFTGGSDGGFPGVGALIFDSAGNLYGTTEYSLGHGCGGWTCGTVFELSPSGSGWMETVVYSFQGGSDGGSPIGGVVFGKDGYLYGTASLGGSGAGGTVLAFNHPSLGPYPLPGNGDDRPGPWDTLTMDSAGNFYGTTYTDGAHGRGSVFKISAYCGCGGCGWTYTLLHDFTGGADGGYSFGNVILDDNGHIFGTTYGGGAYGLGVVFEITPAPDSKIMPAGSFECTRDH